MNGIFKRNVQNQNTETLKNIGLKAINVIIEQGKLHHLHKNNT